MNKRECKLYEILQKQGTLVYKCRGTSMLPILRENRDIVVISKVDEEPLHKYDVVLYVRPDIEGVGKYVLHRIVKKCKNDTYYIIGDNCMSGEYVQKKQIIGVLSSLRRNGKSISVLSKTYKLYVYFIRIQHYIKVFKIKCKAFLIKTIN